MDNLVHRLFYKCVKIPVDELLEVEMLGQRTHACPYNLCFLKLPLIFPPMLSAEASSHAFLKLQEPLLIQDDFLRGHYLLLTPLVGSSEDLATVPVSSYILSPSYHFSSLKVTTMIISGFFASRVMLYICMQIYMLYIHLCMYTYEHTCTRPFPPFYISVAFLPQSEAILRRYLQAATIIGDKIVAPNIFSTYSYLPDSWSEPTGED